MAITLSYGYIQNQTGDRGAVFWPDLEFNIARINGHNHDGSNSALIPTSSIDTASNNVLAAGWAAVVDQAGTYKQTVTVPSGVNLNKHLPRFKHSVSGEVLNLSFTILTTTTFEVFINDATAALQVAYV